MKTAYENKLIAMQKQSLAYQLDSITSDIVMQVNYAATHGELSYCTAFEYDKKYYNYVRHYMNHFVEHLTSNGYIVSDCTDPNGTCIIEVHWELVELDSQEEC